MSGLSPLELRIARAAAEEINATDNLRLLVYAGRVTQSDMQRLEIARMRLDYLRRQRG